jgi:hypothetical protein
MTVQPADPAEPGVDAASRYATVSALAWVIYFGSLVIVYLIAFSRHSLPGQSAAGWGMSISFAFALPGFLVAFGRVGWRPAFRGHRWPATVVLVCALLAAASVAVIWVAINLTMSNQSAGAWLLTVPAAAAPLVLLASPTLARPGLVTVPSEVTLAPPEVTPEVTVASASDVVVLQPPAAATVVDGFVPGDRGPDGRRAIGLLNPRWAVRLGDPAPAVVLDAGFWRMTVRELASHDVEQGGVALMVRSGDVLAVFGVVFPQQLRATSVYCEFSTDDVIRVRRALDQVAAEIGLEDGDITVTWVHTHPHMGPFLSGTDRETARKWRALDPDFTPIVLDAFGRSLERQIGVFDASGGEIGPIAVIDGVVDESATPALIGALRRGYRADGLPDPLVLISGAEERIGDGRPAGRRGRR